MKNLLIASLSLALSLCTAAQRKDLQIGPELSVSQYLPTHANTVFTGGIALLIPLKNQHLSVRSRLSYDRRVPWIDFNSPLYDSNETAISLADKKYDYLHLHFLFQHSSGNKLKLNLAAGPYLSLLMSDPKYYKSNPDHDGPLLQRRYDRMNYGLALSAGISYDLKKMRIGLDGRSNIGLINHGMTGKNRKTLGGSVYAYFPLN